MTTTTTAPAPRLTTANRVGSAVAILARRTFVPLGLSVLIVVAFLGVLYGIAVLQDWQVSNSAFEAPADGEVAWVGIQVHAEPGLVTLRGLSWCVPFTAAWGAIAVVAGLPRLVVALVGLGTTRRAAGIATLLVLGGVYLTVWVLTALGALLVAGGDWWPSLAGAAPALSWLLAVLLVVLDIGLAARRRGVAVVLGAVGALAVAALGLLVLGTLALAPLIGLLTCGFVALMARLPVD